MVKFFQWKNLVTMAAAVVSMGAYAVTPISDAEGLAAMATDPAGDYELTADIVLTGEWTPIGNNDNPFTGTFDGKGHTISGLTISNNGNWVGLFGTVTGTVKNLSLVDVNIYGNEHVGILAGRVRGGGVIESVFTSGYVNGRDHTGGIVGDAGETDQVSTVKNCASSAYVLSRDYQAGGIAGWTKGNALIENNVFYGYASCRGYGATGGIVGFIENGTTTVTHNVCLAYELCGMFSKVDPVTRHTYGIAGTCYNDQSLLVSVDNLVSEATVIRNWWYVADFTGESSNDRNTEFLDKATAPVDFDGIVTPAADLKKAATYSELGFGSAWKLGDNTPVLSFQNLPIKGDFIHTAAIPAEAFINNSFNLSPLSTLGRAVSIATSNASVVAVEGTTVKFNAVGDATVTLTTEGDAFFAGATVAINFSVKDFDPTISSAADLVKFTQNPEGNFVLTADIDLAGVDFTPISYFNGTLDGQGHWIRNASYNNPQNAKAAFFANFGGAFIKNVGFEGCRFIGNEDCAVIAGETTSEGVISNVAVNNCYVQGRDHVGALVGKLNGGATLLNCIANAECVTRQYQCGGLVGVGVNGVVDKCISAGTVATQSGGTNLASIVSLFDADNVTIKNCLAATVTYTNNKNFNANIGNLYRRPIVLENNYVAAYGMKNGVAVAGGEPNSENGGLASKEDVRSKAWYTGTLGLDFTNDWKFLEGGEGNMLPVLSWMQAPVTTTFFNMPPADGVSLVYYIGTEKYEYDGIMGSWGQNITVEQTGGFDYATLLEGAIYAGDENGEFKGAGEATFKVIMDPAIANLFTVKGRDQIVINVSMSGAETEIATVEDLFKIRKNPAGKYVLTADIDLAGVEFDGFCNDGQTQFSGSLDGQGHTIKNFNLSFTEGADKGFFGKTSGATIKNIAFTQFVIDGKDQHHIGLIGSGSSTTLENVAIVGASYGNDHVGLVAGDADGITMTNCYATGKVVGRSQVGGYFGCTLTGGCTLDKCLSNIDVEATYRGWVGGFIGLIDKKESIVTITNSVSIGNCAMNGDGTPKVTAPFIAGNSAGDTPNATVIFTGNIYNTNAIMANDTEWPAKNETVEGGNVQAAEGMNVGTLKTAEPYKGIGWDFNGVWTINADSEYKFPVLATVPVADFTVNDNSGVDNVVTDAKASVIVTAANGEILVAGLGEASVIAVYTTTGVQVANVSVNAAEAAVAVPANGLYIVAVATEGTVATAKVIVK